MISQAVPTGDDALDEGAWGKTQVELDRGIAITLNEWGDVVSAFGPDVIVAVRRAIWERHGNATEWAIRVIDGFRAGLQKSACSYCC